MSTKKNPENAPIKRLVLRREKVRDLNVRAGVKTGQPVFRGPGGGGGVASNGQPSVPVVSHIDNISEA
jgi:hypothetical protein